MHRRKSRRHQIAARARWRAAELHAEAEREAGIPDRAPLTDCREPIDIDLRSYGGPRLRIEPRLGYIACRALLHELADRLPRTLSPRHEA